MAPRDPYTRDLFEGEPSVLSMPHINVPRGQSLSGYLKRSISRALKDCDLTREEVAAKMAIELDEPSFSKTTLDALTAESKEDHQISVIRLVALVNVTGALWLMSIPAKEVGLAVSLSEDALFIEIAKIDKDVKELNERKKHLVKHLSKNRKRP